LILKPVSESRGYGVERWDYRDGRYCHPSGRVCTPLQLIQHAEELARRYSKILVQKRIVNHPALTPFTGSALATTRFVTVFNEDDKPEIVDAFFRTSARAGAVVDNFHSGGLIFPIDLNSGQFRPGFANTPWGEKFFDYHPETGARVAGCFHPAWRDMSDLALRLHEAFSSFAVVGWDIGFSESGLIITEANSTPEISIGRQGSMGGLAGTRLLGLLAYQAAQWLLENEPPESRWVPQALRDQLHTVGNRVSAPLRARQAQ
jgi:hypothetical protein